MTNPDPRSPARFRWALWIVVGLLLIVVVALTAGPLRPGGPAVTSPGASSRVSFGASASSGATPSQPAASQASTTQPAPSSTPFVTSAASTSAASHVFLVVMENQDYTDIFGSSSAPYITELAKTYAYASNYDGIEHPSLGNYLDIVGGTSSGTSSDCTPSDGCRVTSPSVVDLLEARGLTWRGYLEAMGTPCRLTDSDAGDYEVHHNPFVYFDTIRNDPARCAAHDVDLTQLAGDLASAATTPNFVFIGPSSPTHNGSHSIRGGDAWLGETIPPILAAPACTQDTCLVVVVWDEDNYSGRNHVLAVFAGSAAKRQYVSATAYNHFSLLRTIETIFSVGTLTENDAAATPMSDLLR